MAKRVLDFTNVKDQGQFNPRRLPEGVYAARITLLTESVAKTSGNDMWTYTVQLRDHPSCVYPYRCTLNAEALWKVRNLFVACGIDIPKKRLNVDPERPVGKEVAVELEDDEYEGRPKSNVLNVFSLKDMAKLIGKAKADAADIEDDEDDEDDEEELPPKKVKTPPPVEEDDEDEEEEEPAPPPRKKAKKKAPPPPPADDDDDDEEEEPPPTKKKKRKPAPVDDDDEFDLDEV